MADIATGDVTYTILKQRRNASSQNSNLVRLAFGNGALTYPANGIPINIGKLGCPTYVESMVVVDQGASGYRFQYDQSASKLVLVHQGAHTHDLLLKNAAVADGASARVNAGANLLGANTGGDLTVTGAGANGGVVNKTPGALAEASAVAIAAQTIEVEVIGW